MLEAASAQPSLGESADFSCAPVIAVDVKHAEAIVQSELNNRFDQDEALWLRSLAGDSDALASVLDGWVGAVDWPASLLWADLAEMYPDALVILSHRGSFEQWWPSANATVWENMRRLPETGDYFAIAQAMRYQAGLAVEWDTIDEARLLYDRVVAEATASIDPDRLLLWEPTDGWAPICKALGFEIPAIPFFHENDRRDFRERSELY